MEYPELGHDCVVSSGDDASVLGSLLQLSCLIPVAAHLSVVSSIDINMLLPVAMQRLSLKVSVLPNAQHEPQSTGL